jgi:hypothetical protein
VQFESMEEFEQELRQALERRPAPPGLKRRLMEKRRAARPRPLPWQRLAASLALAAVLGGAATWAWHDREERRKGEAARAQVLTALRITGHALNQMNSQLAARGRGQE